MKLLNRNGIVCYIVQAATLRSGARTSVLGLINHDYVDSGHKLYVFVHVILILDYIPLPCAVKTNTNSVSYSTRLETRTKECELRASQCALRMHQGEMKVNITELRFFNYYVVIAL